MKRLIAVALSSCCALSLTPLAHASIILNLMGSSPVAVPGGYDYIYQATLSQDEQMDTSVQPVFFTIYGFGNATLVSNNLLTPSNWSFQLNVHQTTFAEGVTPSNTAFDDVRATYSGPVVSGLAPGTSIGNLGTFTLFTTDTGPYAIFNNDQDAQLEKYAPGSPTNDTPTSNLAAIAIPTNGRAVPEPASMAILGCAVVALGMTRRRKSRQV
jgi:hypothetical protein